MQLVVDSNILFAALIRDSLTRRLFTDLDAGFFMISYNYEELNEHKQELLKKSGLNSVGFELILEQISKKCILIDDRQLLICWKEATEIMDMIDPDDTPFIAAALAADADIWSDDLHFRKQSKIKIWKTEDLAKLF